MTFNVKDNVQELLMRALISCIDKAIRSLNEL